jgi:hypothetical protein
MVPDTFWYIIMSALRHTSETGHLGCEGTIILQMVREGKNIPLNNNPQTEAAQNQLPASHFTHLLPSCETKFPC